MTTYQWFFAGPTGVISSGESDEVPDDLADDLRDLVESYGYDPNFAVAYTLEYWDEDDLVASAILDTSEMDR